MNVHEGLGEFLPTERASVVNAALEDVRWIPTTFAQYSCRLRDNACDWDAGWPKTTLILEAFDELFREVVGELSRLGSANEM